MDDSELQVECPHCGATFGVPDGPAGRQAVCPVCRGAVRVLDVEQAAPAASGELEAEPTDAAPVAVPQEDYFARRRAEGPAGEDTGYYLVCCDREEPLAVPTAGPLISTFTGLAPRDAAAQVTHGMGILAARLAADTAQSMVGALRNKGIGAFAVPVEAAPEPVDRVRFMSIYDVDEKALHVQMDPQGTIRALGWDALVAGVCTKERFGARRTVEEDTEFGYGGGGPCGAPATTPFHTRHVRVEEPPVTVSLVLRDNHGRLHVMAVTARQVRYAYLGERLTISHDRNFGLFLTDVAERAPGAFFPDSYRQVAEGHTMRLVRPFSKMTHENYLRWAVCCAAARGRQLGPGED